MEEKELRKVLRAFEEDGRSASGAHWSIASGEHNLVDFELSRDGKMVVSCIAGELENVSLSEEDFNRIGSVIKREYPDVSFDKSMPQEKETLDVVDWKGFTEEDFKKFKEWDGKSEADFSRQFFAGNMCMKIPDSEELSTGEKAYREVDFVVLRPEGPNTFTNMEFHSEFDLPELNYDDFKGKINEKLTELVNDYHMDEILDARPDKWVAGYCDELTADAKQFLKEGKSFETFEKEVIKKNPRLNASLFGSSKELAKRIRKNLEKDKDIKAFLEKPGNSR